MRHHRSRPLAYENAARDIHLSILVVHPADADAEAVEIIVIGSAKASYDAKGS